MKKCSIVDKIRECPDSPIYLALLIGFLIGVIVGFLVSPVSDGVTIASFNKLTDSDDEDDED